MSPDRRYGRVAGYVWRWCEGTALLLGPAGRRLELQGPPALVWSVLDEPRAAASVHHEVRGITPVGLEPDEVDAALELLVDEGAVVELPVDPTDGPS